MLPNRKTAFRLGVAAFCSASALVTGSDVIAASKKKDYAPLVFDAAKRKKTKTKLTDHISYSAYASLRFQGERNIDLDDDTRDKTNEPAAYLGLAARAKLGPHATAFVHAELDFRRKTTHDTTYPMRRRLNIKEALVAFNLSETSTLTVGRMRFSDAHKWIADASVDGVHYTTKQNGTALEFAIAKDVFDEQSSYLLAHATEYTKRKNRGLYVLAEKNQNARRVHFAAYLTDKSYNDFSYTAHLGAVLGDAANGKRAGAGFDVRAIHKIGKHKWNPQITVGVAGGTEGFQQSGLHSNKTYDGGQTQFNRYGYVYKPELTNIIVGTAALGIRPSRKVSVDLGAHVYAQPFPSSIAPDARVDGTTTGQSAYLGSELYLAGAWRPNRKTKVEFGTGIFKPGAAYLNRNTSKRVYARVSMYF